MSRKHCPKCGWAETTGQTHQAHAFDRAAAIGGYSARRHIKKAAKHDRNRAAWQKLLKPLKRR